MGLFHLSAGYNAILIWDFCSPVCLSVRPSVRPSGFAATELS